MPISIIAIKTEHGFEIRMDEQDLFVIAKKCIEDGGFGRSDRVALKEAGWKLKVIII